jgi:hypothetical protein
MEEEDVTVRRLQYCPLLSAERALFSMPRFLTSFTILASLATSLAAAPDWKSAQALLSANCYDCHNDRKTKGGVNLQILDNEPRLEAEFALWEKVQEVLASGAMPPEDETQLTAAEKQQITGWLKQELDRVANANAGDPGPVTLRRLTNAEYDYTIRDLTAHDYGFGKEFLPDGGGGEGFSNIGDVLFTNPQQLDKYLTAARKLADHATIMPGTGIVFHSQRVGLRGPDQFRAQADQALYVWYQKTAAPYLPKDATDLREADYILACWKWKHKALTGAASLDQVAKDAGLNVAFLENWWRLLNSATPDSRYLDLTRIAWRNLPAPDASKPGAVPPPVTKGVEAIQAERRSWLVKNVQRRQQDADGIRSDGRVTHDFNGEREVHLCVGATGDGGKGDIALISDLKVQTNKGPIDYVEWLKKQPASKALLEKFGKHPQGRDLDARSLAVAAPQVVTLPLPEGAKQITATVRLDMKNPDIESATIQWRFAVGNPPDVSKVMPGVLTLWKRNSPAHRQAMGEFSIMKSAFPDSYERRLEEVARNHTRGESQTGVYYFSDKQLKNLISDREAQHLDNMDVDYMLSSPRSDAKINAERDNRILQHLNTLASLAWRRPTTREEEQQFTSLYKEGLAKELDRESAAREVLVRVLVSPHFLFKAETSGWAYADENASVEPEGGGLKETPLNAWELASRMSYFLWSSKPDAQLRDAAADGSLLKPEVRETQMRRMMRDPKARALAKEFMGQWLEFDGFEKHSAVDAKKFPEFTPGLRQDFYNETVTFFTHLIREDRPVREIVLADYTFLNERLAKFYGVPGVSGNDMQKVGVAAQHRGGLLGMGSLLTKTSRSHRTSPVLRGNWLLQAVLGTPVPPPPPDVPELKEHGPKPATVREMLEQHRANKACASCHDRIDPLGFALENFDAIGRYREKDEAGLPLDTSGKVKSGAAFTGFEGLRGYLKTQDSQFTKYFARKLLGYALGRQVLPTDKPLLNSITESMKAGDGNISTAVLAIVNSRQFLNRRY